MVKGLFAVILSVAAMEAMISEADAATWRRLPASEYVDKMKAGWIGQMAGVGWGAPTEFHCQGQIMPEEKGVPWTPSMINQFGQDDLYVEMTFLGTLERNGLHPSLRIAGLDFAASGYGLAHANAAGRANLRAGIAPPDSGHPQFNVHADDIDYQIEADFSGLVAPGLPQVAIDLGEIFGQLMNYGDGLYAGQFMGGMYAEAFFETDPIKIIEAGLACIPEASQFAECIRDVLAWHRENPQDWQKTWALIDAKYQKNQAYRRFSCDKGAFNIDAKINGAYVVVGLLYGQGDLDKTLIIANRCGQDSDCNPSSAGGVLFATLGASKLPDRFTSALDSEGKFSHTPYTFPKLIEVCGELCRKAVIESGGRIEGEGNSEVFVIPVQTPKPTALEQCWSPGPIANSRFTAEEMASLEDRMIQLGASSLAPAEAFQAFERFAPGWQMKQCGQDMGPGLYAEALGVKNVFLTHPLSEMVGCVLSLSQALPAGRKSSLRLKVGHHPDGNWDLIVKVDKAEILRKPIDKDTAPDGWVTVDVDLTAWAGKTLILDLVNQPTGWAFEAGYWAEISVRSE